MFGYNALGSIGTTPFYVAGNSSYSGLSSMSSPYTSMGNSYAFDPNNFTERYNYITSLQPKQSTTTAVEQTTPQVVYTNTSGGGAAISPYSPGGTYNTPFGETQQAMMDAQAVDALTGTLTSYGLGALQRAVPAQMMGATTSQTIGAALGGPVAAASLLGNVAANAGGVQIHSGTANAAFGTAAGALLGPVGAFIGGAVAPFAVDGIMDGMNMRTYEAVRDTYEDTYSGYFDGRKAGTLAAAISDKSVAMSAQDAESDSPIGYSHNPQTQALSAYNQSLANGLTKEQAADIANAYVGGQYTSSLYDAAMAAEAYQAAYGYDTAINAAFQQQQNQGFFSSMFDNDEDDELSAIDEAVSTKTLGLVSNLDLSTYREAGYDNLTSQVNSIRESEGISNTTISNGYSVPSVTISSSTPMNAVTSTTTSSGGSTGNSFGSSSGNLGGAGSSSGSSGSSSGGWSGSLNAGSNNQSPGWSGGSIGDSLGDGWGTGIGGNWTGQGSWGDSSGGSGGDANGGTSSGGSGTSQGGSDNGEGNSSGFGR